MPAAFFRFVAPVICRDRIAFPALFIKITFLFLCDRVVALAEALKLCDQTLLGPTDLDLGAEEQLVIVPLEKAKEDFQRLQDSESPILVSMRR